MGDNIFLNGLNPGDESRRFAHWFDFPAAMANTALLPVSDRILKEVSDHLGLKLRKEFIVPGWVDAALVSDLPTALSVDDHVRFAFSSRIAPHKGIDLLIEACEILRERGLDGFTVDLYGAGEVALTLQKIRMRNLRQVVRYAGSVEKSEMIARFADHDFLLFPTWEREPFGFVAAEAAYMGCAPIMTGECGAAEWFLDGINSIKIERSAMALAEAMAYVMRMPPEARLAIRTASRAMARELFDFDHWYRRLESVLESRERKTPQGDLRRNLTALTVQLRLWFQ